jgi:hypothetical protein
MNRTAVILPTWNRIEQATACIRRLLDTTQDATVFVVTEDNALKFADLCHHERVAFNPTTPGMTAVQKWNYGLYQARSFDSFVLWADDIFPITNDWLSPALEQLSYGAGCVGFNDGVTDGRELSTHHILSREFIIRHQHGVMCIPHYRSWGLDVETTARAKRAGVYCWLPDVLLDHRHVHWGKAPMDQTYKVGYHMHAYDMLILQARQRANWPDDFEAVIA